MQKSPRSLIFKPRGVSAPMFAVVSPTPSIDMSTEHRSSVDRVSVETTAISAGESTDTRCPCQVPKEQSCSRSFIYCPPFCLTYRREAKGKGVRTDKILFTPVPVPRNGARVLLLEVVPVPGHRAQIFARAPTIYYVQTRCRAREPGTGTKSEALFLTEPDTCNAYIPQNSLPPLSQFQALG